MKNRFKKIGNLINSLELDLEDPSVNINFESRMVLQKLVFIAQALGLSTDYSFNLYIYGPYSPSLAADYYKYPKTIEQKENNISLEDHEKFVSKKIKKYVISHNLFKDHRTEFLEALATLYYFKKCNSTLDDDELFKITKEQKPYLSERLIIIALNTLKELIFRKEDLTPEIREELDLWERIEE